MYKKVTPLPEELTLVLNYKNKKIKITFAEPTIYTIYEVDRLFNKKSYLEIIKILNIPIEEKVFLDNPAWILKAIIELINWNKEKSNKTEDNNFFLFSIFDKLWEKYSKDPIELMKKYTPSQIKSISEWIDFNSNVSSNKEYKNDIYLDPAYIEQKNQEYDEILDRVYKAKEKLGIS